MFFIVLIYFTLALLSACCLVGAIVRLENAKIGHRVYHYKYKFGKTPNENLKGKIDLAVMLLFCWQSYSKKNIGKWYWY